MFQARRFAVCYMFQLAGSPEKEKWTENHVVTHIMRALYINKNSRSSVEKVLLDYLAASEAGEEYDPWIAQWKPTKTLFAYMLNS